MATRLGDSTLIRRVARLPCTLLEVLASHRLPERLGWETDFLSLLVLTRRDAAPVKTSTGNHFPRKYQRIPRNDYQYWC